VGKESDMKSNRGSSVPRANRLCLEQLEARQLLSGTQPTAAQQLLLEQLNDARANPAAYGASIGVDLSGVASAQPLAFNPQLIDAAQQHAQDMNDRGYFGHTTPDGVDPGQRLTNAGVNWTSWGESSAAGTGYTDSASALSALIADNGVSDLAHRKQLLAIDAIFQPQNQVGIGIVQNGSGPLKNYYTIDTAATDGTPFIAGVVYNDLNGNGRYDIGEGLSGLTITVTTAGGDGQAPGQTVTTVTTWDSGGYSIPVAAGNYTVTVSGGSLTASLTKNVTVGPTNVRLNFTPQTVAANSVPAQVNAWIALIYQDVLGRTATQREIALWSGALQNTQAVPAIASILSSNEYTQRLVSGWYSQYLGRPADSAGLNTFATALQAGATEQQVLALILSSSEYFNNHGGTAAGFVQGLYHDLLQRDVAADEAASWMQMAADPSQRQAVAAGILGSAEAATLELQNMYSTFLRRSLDSTGLNSFLPELQAGMDPRTVLEQILLSPEYFSSAGMVLWVQRVYLDTLGRSASSGEVANWVSLLRSGANRVQVATGIASSPEADAQMIDNVYQTLLGRSPDSAALATFTAMLQAGGHLADVISAVAASPEYYAAKGGTDADWVQGLYQDLLGRSPADSEVTLWTGELSSSTRAQVASQFLVSPEYQQRYLEGLGQKYLLRTLTTDEISQMETLLKQGAPETSLIGSLLGGDEYFTLATG
jgi:uncharacterized protein YkwD